MKEEAVMPDLSLQKKAQRLRIYIGESDRWRGRSLDMVLLETLRSSGMAGATIFRGAAGFGAHSRIHTNRIEVLSTDLPILIEVVDSPEKIAAILEVIYPMVREGLITLEDVQIVKYTHRFLNPLPVDRLVADAMTRDVQHLTPDLPVHQAWRLMLKRRIKAAPVVDPTGKVVGILTDGDLLERAGIRQRLSVALRMDAAEIDLELRALETSPLKVQDVLTWPVVTALEEEPLGSATTRMVKAGLKRLPVLNGAGRLVGMLSRLDILRQVAHTSVELPGPHLPSGTARTVADVMSVDFPSLSQDDDLAVMIEKFSQAGSHRLVVIDAQGKAVGLISDSDVVARVQPSRRRGVLDALRQIGKPPAGQETAFDLMSPGPLTAPPQLAVVEAVRLMLGEGRKWLVVVDENGKPLGLVDRQILLEAVISVYEKD
jgi:CBS domain-containing protein